MFEDGYTSIWLEKVSVKKVLYHRHMQQKTLMLKKLLQRFIKKRIAKDKSIQKFRIEKVSKKKFDKLFVTLKGYDNLSNSWLDRNEVIT